MGSEASNSKSQDAVRGSGENPGAGPDEFPREDKFENVGSSGNVFGDKSPRKPPSEGADLARGLSYCKPFMDETPEELGEDRDESTGKPTGPEMGKVDNGGAKADVEWG
jgi:hypothetical protein